MQKKLKKVDENKAREQAVQEMRNIIAAKTDALNKAYQNKDAFAIDNAAKDLLTWLEQGLTKAHPLYTQMKNHTWQRNHLRILGSISDLMQKINCMPTNTQIAIEAGLSDETVYKHLRDFKHHELYQHEADKFQLMAHRVLTTVFNLAVQGDVRACKVFLDYIGTPSTAPAAPAIEQTNYIQINNLKITSGELEQLPPATLQKIEKLIKPPLSKKKAGNNQTEKGS
jgi:hypothetical protein